MSLLYNRCGPRPGLTDGVDAHLPAGTLTVPHSPYPRPGGVRCRMARYRYIAAVNAKSLELRQITRITMSMRIRRALIDHRCLFNPVAWLAVMAVLTLVVGAPWSHRAGITTRVGLVAAALPTPAHVVVVVEENRSAAGIIGNKSAPYINSLATDGALMTQSFAITHPSEPNYLALFAGDTLGLASDACPGRPGLRAEPGLGAARGRTDVHRLFRGPAQRRLHHLWIRQIRTQTCPVGQLHQCAARQLGTLLILPAKLRLREPADGRRLSSPISTTTCTTGPSRRAMPG